MNSSLLLLYAKMFWSGLVWSAEHYLQSAISTLFLLLFCACLVGGALVAIRDVRDVRAILDVHAVHAKYNV